jgi:hydrogenase nickel incorporation protein HypA/HybF
MSLAGSILKVVEDSAQREGFAHVQCLTLEAGALSGVEVRALRFALDALSPGTLLAGAEIVIHEPPGQAWCLRCGERVEISSRADACPRCGGWQLQPTGGMDLRVLDLIVQDKPPGGTVAPTTPPSAQAEGTGH